MPISLAIALIEAPAWIRDLTILIYCIDNIPAPPTYIYMGVLIIIHGLFRFLPCFFLPERYDAGQNQTDFIDGDFY